MQLRAPGSAAVASNPNSGMTCIELIVFMVMIMSAAYGAVKIGPLISTQWWGAVAGGVIGFASFFLVVFLLLLILDAFFGHGMPPCEEGSCSRDDYTIIVAADDTFCYECQHGHRYKRRGRRFLRLNEDGSEAPYYIWKRFRGWRAEKQQ